MWCWKSFSETMKKLGKASQYVPPEEPADPARRSFFGAAVGAAVAAPEIAKAATDNRVGYRLASLRPVLPPYRRLGGGHAAFDHRDFTVGIKKAMARDARKRAGRRNTPNIKARNIGDFYGLPERISRERCHKRRNADA